MNKHLLPRTPKPNPTESQQGYELRLYEANGYTRPYALWSRAGSRIGAGREARISKLESIVGWGDELKKISYVPPNDDYRKVQILGNLVRKLDIKPHRIKLCVECLQEMGFVQAHFDLVAMTACPVHKVMLLTHCETCRKPLSPYRQGLLTCRCGAELIHHNRQGVSEGELHLLELVRRKTLSLPTSSDNGAGFSPDLELLDLSTLLAVIDVLGKHLRVEKSVKICEDRVMIIKVASEALSDWPNGFFHKLDRLGEGFSDQNPGRFTKGRISSLYLALLRIDVLFVLVALSDYMNQNFGEGCRKKLAGLSEGKRKQKYFSKRQAERRYGISRDALDRTIRLNDIKTIKVDHGKKQRIYIDADGIASERIKIGALCNSEQASQIIGLPARLLLYMRKEGLSQPTCQRPKARWFDLPAVREFARLFDPFRQTKKDTSPGTIRLDRLMGAAGISLHVKAMVIDLMLTRKVTVAGSEDGSVAGILIPEELVLEARAREQFVRLQSGSKRAQNSKDNNVLPVTAHEAAQEAECSSGALYALVSKGMLRGMKRKSTLWITRDSLTHFVARYVSILSLARKVGTSTPALMNYCNDNRIDMLMVISGAGKRRQGFVRRGDATKVLEGAKAVLGVYSSVKRSIRISEK